jgi:hydroxymethylbilane synthase
MDNGHCDAMVMAAAGLQRLGLEERITEIIDPHNVVPAVSQGIIAIESRMDDPATEAVLQGVNHEETLRIAIAERAFLKSMDGGCQIPIGCYSTTEGDAFSFTGFVSDLKGERYIRCTLTGKQEEATTIAMEVSKRMMQQGASEILEEIRR